MSKKTSGRFWLALVLALVSLTGFILSAWPSRTIRLAAPIAVIFQPSLIESMPRPTQMIGVESFSATLLPVRLSEPRVARVDWPKRIWSGDRGVVRLSLEIEPQGSMQPETSGTEDPGDRPPVDPDSLYDRYNLVAEARLAMPGVRIDPAGLTSEPMRPGQAVSFSWNITPQHPGNYRGNLWLYMNLVPRQGGLSERIPLLAPPVEINVFSILGLPAGVIRWIAAFGGGLSLALFYPWLIPFFLRFRK
jgi:hypothetical protein